MYALRTMVLVQFAFITTLLYCSPVMHGMWHSRALLLLHLICYALAYWTNVAFIVLAVLWLYVTLVSAYFMHEAWSLRVLAQPVNAAAPARANYRF
jgi:hypothetical protein